MERISKAQVKMVRSLQQKKFRDELGLFVAEGEKCVEELRRGFELVHLFHEGENATRTEIEQMSGLRTPQGVVGVFKKRTMDNGQWTMDDLVLALDGIQDPGNLGTIIRTCDWFGVHDIFCSQDTADCYNPKVVQATMGALARVRVHYVNLPEWIGDWRLKIGDLRIYGTLLDGRDMYEVLTNERVNELKSERVNELKSERVNELKSERVNELKSERVIIMGNEGNGISQEVRKLVTDPIRIPSYPNKEASDTVESLNVSVATAIVLAAFRH